MITLITNNPLAKEYFSDKDNIELKEKVDLIFIDAFGYMDVLVKARDMIHRGYELVTHPLSGSIKPNETPYKSVALKKESGVAVDSREMIEQAILTYKKFEKDKAVPQWIDRVKEDFMVVDFDLIKNALRR